MGQDYELKKVGAKYIFKPESNEADGVPKPVFSMDWSTRAMKKACNLVIFEAQEDIAEAIFVAMNKKREIELADVQKEVCIMTNACKPKKKRKKKESKKLDL